MKSLLGLVGLLLLAEGLLPMIAPGWWRRFIQQMLALPDAQLRGAGMVAVILGCCCLLAAA